MYLSEDGIEWTETTTPSRDLSKAIIDEVNEQVITLANDNISTLNSTLTQWTDTPNTNNYKAVYINTITKTVAFSSSDFAIMSKDTNVLFELGETIKFTFPNGNVNEYAKSILGTSGTIKCLQDMYDGSFMIGVWYDLSMIIDIYGNVSKIPNMVWTEGIVDLYDTEGVYIGWGSMYMSQQTQIWICSNNLLKWEQIQNFGEIITTVTGNTIFTLEKTFLRVGYNKNIIGNTNGNLAISLKVGENVFVYQIAKDSTLKLSYRQKYIGV